MLHLHIQALLFIKWVMLGYQPIQVPLARPTHVQCKWNLKG